jgi:hypothetical protein
LSNRLQLSPVEFNSTSAAGVAISERLNEMLEAAGFAFLVLTGEDEQARLRPALAHMAGDVTGSSVTQPHGLREPYLGCSSPLCKMAVSFYFDIMRYPDSKYTAELAVH